MSQLLSVLCVELPKACRRMSDRWSLVRLCHKCERVFERYGGLYDEIPTKFIDALVAFDETNVSKWLMLFDVYILWLKRQPNSFEEYLRVRDERLVLWRSCVYDIWRL